MTPNAWIAAIVFIICIAAGLLLLVGLCRAAADTRDVVEDAGEYHE